MRCMLLLVVWPVLGCTPADPVGRHWTGGDTADTARDTTDDTGQDTGEPPEPWSFVVFGDNQFATESCTSGISERLAVPEVILDLDPTVVLHSGDLMDHAYDDGAYDQFRACYDDLLGTLPFFPTPGNHDMGTTGIRNYEAYLEWQLFERNPVTWKGDWATEVDLFYEDDPNTYSEDFDAPANRDDVPSGVSFETFYAAQFKNLYLVSFEQGTRWWTNTPRSWLEDHLAAARANPAVDHVVVIMHHPMYSTTMEEDSDGECCGPVREDYEDLFRAYDVTLVFSGHAHVYEHFAVPDDGTATRSDTPQESYRHDGTSVHYVVTGGGGGPLPGCDPMSSSRQEHSYSYLQGRHCGYHVTRVQVEGHRLEVTPVEVTGSAGAWTTETWERWALE